MPRFDSSIAALIDHTLLKPEATESDIRKVCGEARQYGFFSVCVNPCWVRLVAEELAGSATKVCAVVGFPLGANTMEMKAAGADFVKTSTGFGPGGATVEDVTLMRRTVGPSMGVKASGGVRTLEDLKKMVAAGASRVGASASVKIVEATAA